MEKRIDVQPVLTHAEIARILTERGFPTTGKVVWHSERRALQKLRDDPELRQLAEDLMVRSVEE